MDSCLSFKELTIWYQKGKPIIDHLTLNLSTNEVVGLIGLNGAGKTTLINTLSGVHKKYTGGINYSDRNFKKTRYTVFSEDNSFQYYTFNEYFRHVFDSYNKKIDLQRKEKLLLGFNFTNYQNKLIRDLSTGNRKKVFLITGFALCLPFLFLDEPVNGLDFQSTEYLYDLINNYRTIGTILFSSHVLESICLTADRVLVLEKGQIDREFKDQQINEGIIREALHGKNA